MVFYKEIVKGKEAVQKINVKSQPASQIPLFFTATKLGAEMKMPIWNVFCVHACFKWLFLPFVHLATNFKLNKKNCLKDSSLYKCAVFQKTATIKQ